MPVLVSSLIGALFGLGLALGGMTQPSRVLGFLDFFGKWDPSLMFVMVGAIAVFAPLHRYILRTTKPLYAAEFHQLSKRQIDTPLVLGAAVFGVGWGLSGLCPGPALVSAGTGAMRGVIFALSMVAGMAAFKGYERARGSDQPRTGANVTTL
jgi:hypothetical protein